MGGEHHAPAPFARAVGRTRYVVLLAVAAVLVVAAVLFVLGAIQAVATVGRAAQAALRGEPGAPDLTVALLEVVSAMFKAVIFYLIGVGLYSLFIAPLNLPAALGVETLNDLETKIISVVVVLLAVTFLEHYVSWAQPVETLQFAVALAVVTASLVFFQIHADQAKGGPQQKAPERQVQAERQLFGEDRETVREPGLSGPRGQMVGGAAGRRRPMHAARKRRRHGRPR